MLTYICGSESHSVVFGSLQPHGLHSPWNSPGQNTGVGSLSLLQGLFPTQGSNPGVPHCGRILFQLSHQAVCLISRFHCLKCGCPDAAAVATKPRFTLHLKLSIIDAILEAPHTHTNTQFCFLSTDAAVGPHNWADQVSSGASIEHLL